MTSTTEQEEHQVRSRFERAEKLRDIARHVRRRYPDDAAALCEVAQSTVRDVPPVRVRIAAALLEVSDKTVRTWLDTGLLRSSDDDRTTRVLLDPVRLHDVINLLRDLRDAGRDRNLADALWQRLEDQALLDRDDLRKSLNDLRTGRRTPALTAEEESAKKRTKRRREPRLT